MSYWDGLVSGGHVSFREWNCLDPSQILSSQKPIHTDWTRGEGADTPKDARTGRFVLLYWLRIWRFSFLKSGRLVGEF